MAPMFQKHSSIRNLLPIFTVVLSGVSTVEAQSATAEPSPEFPTAEYAAAPMPTYTSPSAYPTPSDFASAFAPAPTITDVATPGAMSEFIAFAPAPLPADLPVEKMTFSGLTVHYRTPGQVIERNGKELTIEGWVAVECGDSLNPNHEYQVGSARGLFVSNKRSEDENIIQMKADARCKFWHGSYPYAHIVRDKMYGAKLDSCANGKTGIASWSTTVDVVCSKYKSCGSTKSEYDTAFETYSSACAMLSQTNPTASCIDEFIGDYTVLMGCASGNFDPETEAGEYISASDELESGSGSPKLSSPLFSDAPEL